MSYAIADNLSGRRVSSELFCVGQRTVCEQLLTEITALSCTNKLLVEQRLLESVVGSPHSLPQFHNTASVNLQSGGRVVWRCTVVTPPPAHQLKSISITVHTSRPGHDISIFYLLHTPCIRFLIIMMAIQCDYRSNEVTIGHCHLPAHHLQGDVGREGDDVNMLRKCTHATLTIQQSQVGQLWMASSAVLVCLVPTASSVSNLVRQLLQLAATTYKQHTQ